MPICGHGIDLVEVKRIAALVERYGGRFLDRVFTAGEQVYSGRSRRRFEHLAARFAAKEAVFKALGSGWGGLAWTDVEVERLPGGEPALLLHGAVAALAAEHGISSWRLSLTHTGDLAAASVVAWSD